MSTFENACGTSLKALARKLANEPDEGVLRTVRAGVRGGGAGAVAWRRAGGLPPLCSALLRPSNGSTPSPALLSALADCCLEDESCREIGKLAIEGELVALIKNSNHDSTVGRICRIVGNLARDVPNSERLHGEGAVAVLLPVIENERKSSLPTLIMAVRAIRSLWTVEARREEMVANGAVRAVAALLCAECVGANLINSNGVDCREEKKDILRKRNDLFAGLLKCLGFFTTFSTFQCAQQILGDGRGYHCLVKLTEKFESPALQCLLNLCYVSACRPLLGAAGAVECLIDFLNLQIDWPVSWIKALGLLCREAVNRAKVRDYGGLSLLIMVVKDTSNLTRHLYVLQALLLFIFDSCGLKVMVKEGLIETITKLLKDHVALMKYEHCSESDEDLSEDNFLEHMSDAISDDMQNETSDFDTSDTESRIQECDNIRKRFPHINKKEDFIASEEGLCPQKKTKYDRNPNCVVQDSKQNSKLPHKHQSPNLSPYSESSAATSMSPDYYKNKPHRHAYATTSADMFGPSLYYYNNRSPESITSSNDGHTSTCGNASLWSPDSTRMCYSPSSVSQCDDDSSESDKSGHYSPVCSDIEENDKKAPIDIDCLSESNGISDALEDYLIDDEIQSTQKLEFDDTAVEQIHSHRIRYLLLLLFRFSRSKSVKLTSKDLLFSLIYYISKCRNPVKNIAVKTVTRIISNVLNIKHLLSHSLVLDLYCTLHNPKHEKCRQCKQVQKIFTKLLNQMSIAAESEYGIGQISYQLLKGDSSMKETLALTLPYLIKTTRNLKKIFMDCEALELFLNILAEYKKPEHCVSALTQLATNLRIRPPRPVFASFKGYISLEYNPRLSDETATIFVLDDSSTVQADLQLLCQYSDVFVAMLCGSFKEALQKRVRLQKVSKASLEYLFTLLEYGVHIKPVETFPLPKTLPIALETLLLADRFLMEKVKNLLFSAIIQFKLDSNTADEIYIWSLEEGMGTLCMESVAYTLVGQMSDEKKCVVISTIMNTVYKNQWIDDVRYSLCRFMK